MGEDPSMSPAAFAQSLGRLDASGGVVLVVGQVDTTGHRTACRAFSPAGPETMSILVTSDGFCHDYGTDRGRRGPVIAYTSHRRAASTPAPGGAADDDPCPDVYCSTPAGMAEEVGNVIERDPVTAGEDTEIRVCLDSLSPLLADHSGVEVRDALERVAASIRRVGGLAHAHLPVGRNHATLPEIVPACRCVLELDHGTDGIRHRWHFAQRGASTEWYPLPEARTGPR